jgi:hypothetical protein
MGQQMLELLPEDDPEPKPKREPEKATDGWFRELKDGRMECMLKTPGIRLRVSGPAERVWAAVEMFEEWTGKQVAGDWKRPPKRGARPMEGQTDIFMDQRPSEGDSDE